MIDINHSPSDSKRNKESAYFTLLLITLLKKVALAQCSIRHFVVAQDSQSSEWSLKKKEN